LRKFEYSIAVKSLIEPIGGIFAFVARLDYFRERIDSGIMPIDPKLGEPFGRTGDEAEAKLRTRVEAWIARNQ
jgi:hypothetical protein